MKKTLTVAAFVGAVVMASVPAQIGSAYAQAAAGPEPMQGAQPMDNPGAGGAMEKSDGKMSKKPMKHSAKKMKHKKAM